MHSDTLCDLAPVSCGNIFSHYSCMTKTRGCSPDLDSFQFRKIIPRYTRICYNLDVMRQPACLVFNPSMADTYAAFFNCTPVGWAPDSDDGSDIKLFTLVSWGQGFLPVARPTGVSGVFFFVFVFFFFFFWTSVSYSAPRDLHRRTAYLIYESSFLIHHGGYHELFVCP